MTSMTSTTNTNPQAVQLTEGDQCVTIWEIGWEGYRAMLRLRGRQNVPRMTYLDGDLWLMSPSFIHESLAERLGSFVVEVAVGAGVPYLPAGHTTFRRLSKKGGVEADKSYYFANEGRVRGKKKIDLRNDPPPDLVIEAVYTHEVASSIEVWQRFEVPEIWICDPHGLQVMVRQADGLYADSETSHAFPYLRRSEIFDWATRVHPTSDLEWSRDVRRWVQEVLIPRVRGQGG